MLKLRSAQLLGLAILFATGVAGAPTAADTYLAELRQLVGGDSRLPGSPANRRLQAHFAERFAASGHPHGAIRMRCPVLTPGTGTVVLADGSSLPLLPMHPSLMRPGNLTQPAVTTTLVYLGRCTPADLKPLDGVTIAGAVGVAEFAEGGRWLEQLSLGLRAIVFLGADEYSHLDAVAKVYNTEARFPRFFVPLSYADQLRRAAQAQSQVQLLTTPTTWHNDELQSPWVLIPGSDPQLRRQVIVLTAPLDANCVVPDLATGGQSAPNLLLLAQLFDDLMATPSIRSVLLVAVNAHTQKYKGERALGWHLTAAVSKVESLRGRLARDMRIAQLFRENYQLLHLQEAPVTDELDARLDLLWALDKIQHERRQQLVTAAREARQAELERLHDDEQATAALLAEPLPQVDPVLDLEDCSDDELHRALTDAVSELQATETGWLSRISRQRREASTALVHERHQLEAMAQCDAAELRRKVTEVKAVFDDEKLLESWRGRLDGSSGVRLPIKRELQQQAKRRLNELKLELLEVAGNEDLPPPAREARLLELRRRKLDLTQVLVLFNKVDIGIGRSRVRYREIARSPVQTALLREYREEIVAASGREADALASLLELDGSNDAIRSALGDREVSLYVNLDMNWLGAQVGFCTVNPSVQEHWYLRLGQLSQELAAGLDSPDAPSPYLDTLTMVGGRPQTHYFNEHLSPAIYLQANNGPKIGTPAMALRDVHTSPGRAFTPNDDLSHLDAAICAGRHDWLRRFFRVWLDHPDTADPGLLLKVRLESNTSTWFTRPQTMKIDDLAASTTPSEVVPNCLIAAYTTENPPQPAIVRGDVINCLTEISDITGTSVFTGLIEGALAPIAYQLDERQTEVLHTIDRGQIQSSGQQISNINQAAWKVLAMFAAREFNIRQRTDPSMIGNNAITLRGLWPMSQETRAEPRRYGLHGLASRSKSVSHLSHGPASIFLENKAEGFAEDSLIVVTQTMRVAGNNSAEAVDGSGYDTDEALGPDLFARCAADMAWLNQGRLARMTGVANRLVQRFVEEGRAAIDQAVALKQAGRHAEARRLQYLALGAQTKAYDQTRVLYRDMLNAVVFYMALLLPFCLFLEKLLFKFVRIEHELLAFSLLFIGTYTIFRFIHPAFSLAMNPEAIFIAFVLGAIGVFIVWVLHNRFEGEMQLLFNVRPGEMSGVGYSMVGQTAMNIGVNNMKRRRIRTSLTMATIVLVTFAMLAFSSVSKTMNPALVRRGDWAPYTGLFFHWPAGKAIDEATVNVFAELFSDTAEVLVRRIAQPPLTPLDRLPTFWRLTAGGERALSLGGIIGLTHADNDLLGRFPLLAGDFFSSDTAAEAILPAAAAEALGLSAADIGHTDLRWREHLFRLVGIVDDARYRALRDLNPALPLLPHKQIRGSPGGMATSESVTLDDSNDASLIDTDSLLLLPAGRLAELGGQPYTVSVRFRDEPGAAAGGLWSEINALLIATKATFFVGARTDFKTASRDGRPSGAGSYLVSAGYRTSLGGLGRLLIPLLIAATIILNTMLGTVYERKQEIAVYNAIGLNPTHIFLFFLAEAFVYSVIGAVGGYLVGQVLAVLIKTMGLIPDINVNFSSLMVIYAIAFVIATVVLSTIYPARVATRTAVPSGRRSWSLPDHDGQQMRVSLPFIYQPRLVPGVMAYLHEYFGRFTEKSIGDQIAELRSAAVAADSAERPTYHVVYDVALAPFDLGVTQTATFNAHFDERLDSYTIELVINRRSGQDSNWTTTNRPFLEKLRKLLIDWRNLDNTRHGWYVGQGGNLFGHES